MIHYFFSGKVAKKHRGIVFFFELQCFVRRAAEGFFPWMICTRVEGSP